MLTGDYKIQNIFSGIITNFDEEKSAVNFGITEKIYCTTCGEELKKYHNYELFLYGNKFFLDISICDNCKIAYEFSYLYNKEMQDIKKYIKRNKLNVFDSGFIQAIN